MSSLKASTKRLLQQSAKQDRRQGINALFAEDAQRAERFSYEIAGLYLDFSKTHLSTDLIDIYAQIAEDIDFVDKRHALFTGERVNLTENRAVLHSLLRDSDNQGLADTKTEFLQQAKQSEQQFLEQYESIQQRLSERDKAITDIIHVGIGGSSLGSQLVFESLASTNPSINVHFISNVDGHQLVSVLKQCEVETTLVIGVSKTFSTAETLKNLHSIGVWFEEHEVKNYLQHFIAVTANSDNARQFGVFEQNIVTFPTWVGGRYSVWSSVSLSVALVIGMENFQQFLSGAAVIDQYFYSTEPKENICFLAAALDHYYANYLSAQTRAVFAYDYRLRSLVDYLQQLETESNGKDRQVDGSPVDQITSPIVWGGVGTDVQHSVFQLLHQGTHTIPSEFILVKTADHHLNDHHTELLINGIAQTAALLVGQDIETVKSIYADDESISDEVMQAKVFSGERPSTTLLIEQLSPSNLGSLLAFYEHRTFCMGALLNINSYDQMGVELGKRLAKEIEPLINNPADTDKVFDPSTRRLLSRLLK